MELVLVHGAIFFPWLSLIGMVGVLVESGRVPGDLSEAESELVSG